MNTYKKLIATGMIFVAMGTYITYGAEAPKELTSKYDRAYYDKKLTTLKAEMAKGKKIYITDVDENGDTWLHCLVGSGRQPTQIDISLAIANKQGHTPLTLAIVTFKRDMPLLLANDACYCEKAIYSPLTIGGQKYRGIRNFILQTPLLSDEERTAIDDLFSRVSVNYGREDLVDLYSPSTPTPSISALLVPSGLFVPSGLSSSASSEEDAKRRAAEQSALTLDKRDQ